MAGGVSANPIVDLTSPLFNRVTLHLDPAYYQGRSFVIKAKNNSRENIYIQKARLNGIAINKPYISFSDIVRGGELEFVMGAEPSDWGR